MRNIKSLLSFLNDGELDIRVGWIDKKTDGCVDPVNNEIVLNFAVIVADIFVHEWEHVMHPEMSEEQIINVTTGKIMSMSVDEIQLLATAVMERVGIQADLRKI